MSSIIEYFNKNNFEYSASSLTYESGGEPENAFAKSGYGFVSKRTSLRQWWQVSFSRPVVISSYFMTYTASNKNWAKSLEVSISNDNKTFDLIKTQEVSTICGNTKPYLLDSPVSCKYFRLTMNKPNSYGAEIFFFRGFDCFGVAGEIKTPRRTRLKCSCNFPRYKRQLISNNLIAILPLIINKWNNKTYNIF